MVATYVQVTIWGLHERSRRWTNRFLAGTGATETVIPRDQLHAIGIVPERQRVYQLPDGRETVLDVASAQLEIMGEYTVGLVVFGETNSDPLLGKTAMASVGVEVDPRTGRLTKLPAVRLKAATGRPT